MSKGCRPEMGVAESGSALTWDHDCWLPGVESTCLRKFVDRARLGSDEMSANI